MHLIINPMIYGRYAAEHLTSSLHIESRRSIHPCVARLVQVGPEEQQLMSSYLKARLRHGHDASKISFLYHR